MLKYPIQITKQEILEQLNIPLPTIKTSQLIIRQKNHPLGDWEIFKPTKKHKYYIKQI